MSLLDIDKNILLQCICKYLGPKDILNLSATCTQALALLSWKNIQGCLFRAWSIKHGRKLTDVLAWTRDFYTKEYFDVFISLPIEIQQYHVMQDYKRDGILCLIDRPPVFDQYPPCIGKWFIVTPKTLPLTNRLKYK